MKKIILVVGCLLIFTPLAIFGYIKFEEKKNIENRKKENNKIVKVIKSYYSDYVITTKETKLYKKEKNKFVEYGKIGKNVKVKLVKEKISLSTKYFLIDGLNLYIDYSSLKKTNEFSKSDRYKNYIPFNKSIKTNGKTAFYDSNKKLVYELNESVDLPIIVSDNDYSGVEYNNSLFYIKNSDGQIYDNENSTLKTKEKIRVLTYHFIYDPETESCNEAICFTLSKFEEHAKYLRENEYFTMKLDELEMYLDGKIQIPEKSIVLTIDDGTLFNLKALDILEKYKVNLTMFVVTGWVGVDNLKSDYLDLESHTDNMHNQYECPGHGSQGGGILCLPEDKVLNDLKTSQDKLGGSIYFAYPFFDFNDRAIELLKKVGFHMAFIGQYDSDGYSFPNKTDKFKVRRKTIFNDLTQDEFIEFIK